jgi:RNA polymerase sigma-70 factor, ECF subfamily
MMILETEGASRELRSSSEKPSAALVLAAFQNTPWERTLRRTAQRSPGEITDVFRGLTALYWAYAPSMPQAHRFEAPTRALLADIAGQSTGENPQYDPMDLYEISTHIQGFVGIWASIQHDALTDKPTLASLTETLYADAARTLDTIEYANPTLNHQLETIVREQLGLQWAPGETAPPEYTALTRHFTRDQQAPPFTVPSQPLTRALAHMRTQYAFITALPDYQGSEDGKQLLREVFGAHAHDNPQAVNELFMRQPDPAEQEYMHLVLGVELASLADSELVARARATAKGRLATKTRVVAPQPADETFAEAEEHYDEVADVMEAEEPYNGATENAGEITVTTDHWELIARIREGGEDGSAAFAQLYAETYHKVNNFAYSLLRDHDQAEDITSRVYETALKKIGTLENRGFKVVAWLMTVTRNKCADYATSSPYKREVLAEEMPAGTSADSYAGYAENSEWRSPERAVISSAEEIGFRKVLLGAIEKIRSEEQRECIMLRFFEERPIAEVATIMGVNEGAVKALQHRAMIRLRQILQSTHPHLMDAFSNRVE